MFCLVADTGCLFSPSLRLTFFRLCSCFVVLANIANIFSKFNYILWSEMAKTAKKTLGFSQIWAEADRKVSTVSRALLKGLKTHLKCQVSPRLQFLSADTWKRHLRLGWLIPLRIPVFQGRMTSTGAWVFISSRVKIYCLSAAHFHVLLDLTLRFWHMVKGWMAGGVGLAVR